MKNKVDIQGDKLIVAPQGLHKIWALKGQITLPLSHVRGATLDNGMLLEKRGIRLGGTAIGGYYAGTFVKAGEKVFYNANLKDQVVVITLRDEDYAYMVLGVENPRKLVDEINSQLT